MSGCLKSVGCLVAVLVAIVVIGLVANPRSSAARPTSAPRAGMPTSAPRASTPGVYYLYYRNNPVIGVAIIGRSHQSGPVDGSQLANWVLSGTACVADAGTKAYRADVTRPAFTTGVEVGAGICRGFLGWVPNEAFQPSPK